MVMVLGTTPGHENGPKKLPTADCPLPTIFTIKYCLIAARSLSRSQFECLLESHFDGRMESAK
jgi:hypothetical protein